MPGKLRITCTITPQVEKVHFLDFLEQGTQAREIYERQSTCAGSTFGFDIRGGETEAFRVLDSLRIIKLAVSLGGTESLMEHPVHYDPHRCPGRCQKPFGHGGVALAYQRRDRKCG